MLQIAMSEGQCMDHAKERLVKYLADQIHGYRQAEPAKKDNGCLEGDSADPGSYVDIAIHLFSSPEFELDDYELTGQGIREYAIASRAWLETVAEAVDKLIADGWNLQVVQNNIDARHPEVLTCEEAAGRLRRLGVEDVVIDIAEWSADGERLTLA
jgi:hypothetical protein